MSEGFLCGSRLGGDGAERRAYGFRQTDEEILGPVVRCFHHELLKEIYINFLQQSAAANLQRGTRKRGGVAALRQTGLRP